jgi:hypothetical protein
MSTQGSSEVTTAKWEPSPLKLMFRISELKTKRAKSKERATKKKKKKRTKDDAQIDK